MLHTRFFFFALFILFFASARPSFAQNSDSGKTKKELKEEKKRLKKEEKERKKSAGKTKNAPAPASAALDPKQKELSESLFVDGVKYAMIDDYPKALDSFKKAYAINPKNAAINFKIAEMYMHIRHENDALPFAKAALELDPSNSYYYLILAELYSNKQQFSEAAAVYSRLVDKFPEIESFYFNLADLYLAQNKPDEAVKIFDRVEKKFGQTDELSFKKQQLYLKQNNLEKALAEGNILIQNNPTEIRYVLGQAQILASNNRVDEAIVLLKNLLRSENSTPQIHLMLADMYQQKKQPELANQELKIAFAEPGVDIDSKIRILIDYIKLLPNPELLKTSLELASLTVKAHPSDAKAYAVNGDLQAIAGQKKEARDNYAMSLRFDKSHFQVWQQLIVLDAELGQNDSLLVHTQKATELFPNQAVVWFYNGTANLIKKNYSKAAKSLEYGKKLSADNPDLLEQFNIQLGDAYHSLKQYEKSNAAYEAVLANDPKNVHVLNNYSYFLSIRDQNLDKAKTMAEKLISLAPEEATYLDTYAWVLYKLKDYGNARKFIEKALLTTKDGTVMEHYGDILFRLGEKEEALKQWQKAKATGEASEFIDKKIRDKKIYE